MNEVDVRIIEDAGLRAWPALEAEDFGGWPLRASNGFTKRANSVQPRGLASRRRRGYGAAAVAGLTAWGAAQGAGRAHLQVVRSNLPAAALYRGLGFRPAYAYWYRVQGEGRRASYGTMF